MRAQTMQQHVQEIQIQRPDQTIQQTHHHPLIITTNLNPATMLNGQQLIQTSNGQIIQAQIGQFVQGPNNTIQMITTNAAPQPQLLQIRPDSDNRLTELIVQPEMSEPQFYEEIPVLLQSANGQQTIVNLPHSTVQQLQQQQQQHQVAQLHNVSTAATVSSSVPDEIEIHEVQNYDDDDEYDLEEVIEEDNEQEIDATTTTTTFYVQRQMTPTEDTSEIMDQDVDKQLFAEFLAQQTSTEGPNKHICNLCQGEFKQMKWLESHMKTIHSNWIKANCKKQPQCQICGKSFRGPGMLKMHQKVS
jgi:hypothetical protein